MFLSNPGAGSQDKMSRGRPGLGYTREQIRAFQRALRAWMAENNYTAKEVAELVNFTEAYIKLLAGEYQEKYRCPSATVIARLREIGFEWSPPATAAGTQPPQESATLKKKRRSSTKNFTVTRRDVDIILFLAKAEVATREHLQRLFFRSPGTACLLYTSPSPRD